MRLGTTDSPRPAFSVVTVCRNAERSIAKAIDSVRQQAGSPGEIEHIVIDAVSTDGTLAVLSRYPHLRVVSEPDAGIYDAMNKGVALAQGEYISILNADDWYEPHAFAAVARTFDEAPATSVVYGDIRRWNRVAPIDVAKPSLEQRTQDPRVMPVHHPACFVKREVFARVGGFDLSFPVFADFDWIRRVINAGAVLRYCPQVLTNFRLGGVSTVRFAVGERYRVFRASGSTVAAAAATVAYSCVVVLRNRLRQKGAGE